MKHGSQPQTHQFPAHSMRFCFRLPHVLLMSGEQLLFKPERRKSWGASGRSDWMRQMVVLAAAVFVVLVAFGVDSLE
jgi:hypothetical protein